MRWRRFAAAGGELQLQLLLTRFAEPAYNRGAYDCGDLGAAMKFVSAKGIPNPQRLHHLMKTLSTGQLRCVSILLQCCLVSCVVSVATATHAWPILFESATLGPTGVQGGALVDQDHFVGVRFSVPTETHVSGVGGQFWGMPGSNDLFAALLKLPHQFDFPAPGTPFDSSQLVASAVFTTPVDKSDDVVIPLATTLAPGDYALVFGSGFWGASGSGALNGGTDVGDPSYFFSVDGKWFDSGFGGRRFVIYVPEPSTIALFAIGAIFLVRRR